MEPSFEAAIFDLDGLLVDTEALWDAAKTASFAEVGLYLSEAMCAETKGFRQRDMVAYWFKRRPWSGPSPADVERLIIELFVGKISAAGVTALPGAMQVIAELRRIGLPLAVASSSPLAVIRAVVDALGLDRAFHSLCSAEAEARGKPDPAVYLTAARHLGVAPAACLAFEDSAAGVEAAVRAGMFTVAVPSRADHAEPRFRAAQLVLTSLQEFTWPPRV